MASDLVEPYRLAAQMERNLAKGCAYRGDATRAVNTIRLLCARIEELERAHTWRPIESAPKDGSWVLLYKPIDPTTYAYDAPLFHVYVATWEPIGYYCKPQWAYGPNADDYGFRTGVYGATHWQPLPAPPGESPVQDEGNRR